MLCVICVHICSHWFRCRFTTTGIPFAAPGLSASLASSLPPLPPFVVALCLRSHTLSDQAHKPQAHSTDSRIHNTHNPHTHTHFYSTWSATTCGRRKHPVYVASPMKPSGECAAEPAMANCNSPGHRHRLGGAGEICASATCELGRGVSDARRCRPCTCV